MLQLPIKDSPKFSFYKEDAGVTTSRKKVHHIASENWHCEPLWQKS